MADPVVERLADNTLLLVQELRNGSKQSERIAEKLHGATEAMLALKRELSDSNATHEGILRDWVHTLKSVNERLAVIGAEVEDVEGAANTAAAEAKATREATGTQKLAEINDTKVGLLQAFGALSKFTQVLIVIVLLVCFGGTAAHWLATLVK